MSDQPDALVLADALEKDKWNVLAVTLQEAADELRLLHSINEQLRNQNTELDAACAKLEAENEALKADALRYRWVRDSRGDWAICEWEDRWYRDSRAPHVVDAAIDAAMKDQEHE